MAREPVSEKRMFGGLAFLHRGNMCCGILGEELMVRVGPEAYPSALELSGAREMDFTGRALRGFVYVSEAGLASDGDLAAWVERSVSYAATLPAKDEPVRRRGVEGPARIGQAGGRTWGSYFALSNAQMKIWPNANEIDSVLIFA